MPVVIDQMNVDVAETGETQRRGSGGGDDAGSGAGGELPKPEEFERIWQQQAERAERLRAH
ncbi:MAG TPA: hypothetical protein VGX24_06830 [Pyrinomonadaceae bacterium]|jgi:hypothetical protein|nr:hypothetical protein [Pyrinomonadaceae bacterium]